VEKRQVRHRYPPNKTRNPRNQAVPVNNAPKAHPKRKTPWTQSRTASSGIAASKEKTPDLGPKNQHRWLLNSPDRPPLTPTKPTHTNLLNPEKGKGPNPFTSRMPTMPKERKNFYLDTKPKQIKRGRPPKHGQKWTKPLEEENSRNCQRKR